MANKIDVDKIILSGLVDLGIRGDSARFQMQVKRLVSKLDQSESRYAKSLMQKLPSFNATREVAQQAQPVDPDSRLSLLREYYSLELEKKPFFDSATKQSLDQLLNERRKADLILSQDLTPIRTVLFEGPPGVGKTLSAKWIAKELSLPLLVLDLATVMSSFLGKTGNNIRMVLDYASSFSSILLLDEFDTIAKRRDDDKDVGELKRLVTVLLQTIEDWPASSILIAATNHGELLDPAVWRRFDNVIHFKPPSKDIIQVFLKEKGIDPLLTSTLTKIYTGQSLSDIERSINLIKKEVLISERSQFDVVQRFYNIDNKADKSLRDKKVLELAKKGYSQRKISKLSEVSRPTVKKILEMAGEL